MPLPDDQEGRLRCYRNALRNWNYADYVRFKERVQEWLRNELAFSQREVARLLHACAETPGAIDEQVERRPEYAHYQFHYDLRVRIGDRQVYFETLLFCDDPDDPDDPYIVVVSVHDV